MSLEECGAVLDKHLSKAGCVTQLQRNFWLQYMLRRHILLKHSDQFNLNEIHQKHGSTTMSTMLNQVRCAVTMSDSGKRKDGPHEEMIYWREEKKR
ncbi:hypothetical protein STCU_11383 [Strigomonas culicis]|uniref:Uncharacterized protein n=1 Tax=Strigomonas culicis TaxID=28005 RepID=S9TE59_9TRYP|nr:hypothetical protein STCU_11383 [Strigomonas culicis]|eukprot:EPY16342.1 hypothetical protein STCU_11383 [Strigomonas culicis]